jgi:hypothetical protein
MKKCFLFTYYILPGAQDSWPQFVQFALVLQLTLIQTFIFDLGAMCKTGPNWV